MLSDVSSGCAGLRGLVCPPNQTWQEYLASAAADGAAGASGFDVEGALAFVRAYNAVRFGPQLDRETLDALASRLAGLEQARITPRHV